MPPKQVVGSPESSDGESVNTNTTAPSEARNEYPLEGILAERTGADGVTRHLVKWEGYPDERCTWETRSNFQDEETFHEWQDQKMRISRGLAKAYNVEALESRVETWINATEKRKSRRRAKRLRLGLPVTPSSRGKDGETSSDEASADDEPELLPPEKKRMRERKDSAISVRSGIRSKSQSNASSRESTFLPDKIRQWTPQEQAALMKGLERAKGPFWSQILSLFGSSGTVNQALKDRDIADLKIKAQELRYEFQVSGRDVPQYLQQVESEAQGQTSRNSKKRVKRQKKEESSKWGDLSEDDRSSLSDDSLMKEFQTSALDKKIKPGTKSGRRLANIRGGSTLKLATRSMGSNSGTIEETEIKSEQPKSRVLVAQMVPRPEAARQAPSRPAAQMMSRSEAVREELPRPKPAQMGTTGRGPLRLGMLDRKLVSAGKRQKITGPAIFGNWDANVKPKPKLPLQNTVRAADRPVETFGKLATKRRYEKRSRNEPAPNPDSLTLIKPQDGRVVRIPSVESPLTRQPAKTPYEMIQEGFKESNQDSEIFDSHSVSTLKPDTSEALSYALDPAEENDITTAIGAKSLTSSHSLQIEAAPGPNIQKPSTSAWPSVRPSEAIQPVVRRSSVPFSAYAQQLASSSRFQPDQRTMASPSFDPPTASGPSGSLQHQQDSQTGPDFSQVFATIKLGPGKVDVGDVRFRDLNFHAKRLLLSIKVGPRDMYIWFKLKCGAEDYKEYFHTELSEYIGSGYIEPFPHVKSTVDRMAETLRMHVSGGTLFANDFAMVVYPAGSEDWTFLDEGLPAVPSDAVLRFVIRKPLPGLEVNDGTNIATKKRVIAIREGETNINIVFRVLFKIEYSRLVASTTPHRSENLEVFFIIFPPGTEDERDLVIRFLQENGAKDIYSWETPGSWDYFSNKIDAGVIIVHEDYYDLWRIPNLSRVLRKSINVWNLNLIASPLASDPHLNRLFPHGGAFLLTDSIVLLRPHDAARFLAWFRLVVLPSKPAGTWKIVTRPRIRDWLLCLRESRDKENGHIMVQCYHEIWWMLSGDEDFMEYDLDDPTAEQTTEDAPIEYMPAFVEAFDEDVGKGAVTNAEVDHEAIAKNDELLINFFAGWAMTKLEHFRRFHVITGAQPSHRGAERSRKKTMEKWNHIEIITAEACYDKHRVPSWDLLQEKQARFEVRERARWAQEAIKEKEAAEKKEKAEAARKALGIEDSDDDDDDDDDDDVDEVEGGGALLGK